jgi:hypothetical protein
MDATRSCGETLFRLSYFLYCLAGGSAFHMGILVDTGVICPLGQESALVSLQKHGNRVMYGMNNAEQ